MTDGEEIESILAIDGGNVTTRAVLLDRVEGAHRFIAKGESPTTLTAPENDFRSGLQSAIQQLEKTTGRLLLSDQGHIIIPEQPDGHGVDALVVTTSVSPPLRVVIAGLIHSLSVESACRAVESSYAEVQDVIALDEGPQRWGAARGMEAKLEALCQNPPDVILMVGGVDGGAFSPIVEISQVLATLASVLETPQRPAIIFAGNQEARSAVAELLAGHFEFRAVDNLRPTLDVETLTAVQLEMERLYNQLVMKELPHLDVLANWSSASVVSSAKALELVVRFVARQYGLIRGVLGMDIGGSNTQLFATIGDKLYGLVRSNWGSSYGLEALLERVSPADLGRWLPFDMPAAEVRNRLLNKRLRPMSLPQTREDLFLEQAAAREALRLLLEELRSRWAVQTESSHGGLLPPLDLIIASGGVLSHAPNPGQAALILLDACQPVGLSRLVLDQLAILPTMGAVATFQPFAAAQVLDQDGFLELGTVVAPLGVAREGDISLRFKMTYADGSAIQVEVPYGSLELIPLPLGQMATLELHPARGFDIGWGRKGHGGRVEVQGGALGVIIDARGRPLTLPPKREKQQARMQEWLWSIGG